MKLRARLSCRPLTTVFNYDELLAGSGDGAGVRTVEANCMKAFAKSYARHLEKAAPDHVHYFAEPEPERWV